LQDAIPSWPDRKVSGSIAGMKGGNQMAQRRKKPGKAARDLTNEWEADQALKRIIFESIAAGEPGAYLVLHVPVDLLRKLAAFEERRRHERETN
jgi:hypothetical protein